MLHEFRRRGLVSSVRHTLGESVFIPADGRRCDVIVGGQGLVLEGSVCRHPPRAQNIRRSSACIRKSFFSRKSSCIYKRKEMACGLYNISVYLPV